MKYVLDVVDCQEEIRYPQLTFGASDEYATEVVIQLPGGQSLNVIVTPDYEDPPRVRLWLTQ